MTQTAYDADTGLTTYRSPRVMVGRVSMSGGLSSGQRVTLQVVGTCEGERCAPSSFEMVFLNDSGRDLNLDYRRIEFEFSGRSLEFEDVGRVSEPTQYATPRGEFLRIPVSVTDFRSMTSADEVVIAFGLTGTTRMELSDRELATLRAYLSDATA